MYFDSVQAALYMDGHGPFVWAAYAITFFVIGLLLLAPERRRRRLLRELEGEVRRSAGAPQKSVGG